MEQKYEVWKLSGFLKSVVGQDGKGSLAQKFCFLLGAGASRSSGIRSGAEMVKDWEKDLAGLFPDHEEWKEKKGITPHNMASFYSDYYDRRYGRTPAAGYNYLEKEMEQASPSIGYIILSGLLMDTPHRVVVTTNFDHLLEQSFNDYTIVMPQVIGHEALAHYALQPTTRPRILKIHRDLLLAPKSSKEDTGTLDPAWGRVLDHVLREYHPIVIGYAGNDRSVMNFLTENAEKFLDDTWKCPYWTVYQEEQPNELVEEFLNRAQGVLIRTDGFDDVMVQMGSELGYTLPRRDNFMKQAEERYDKISGQYRELRKKIAEREKEENRDTTEVEVAMDAIYPPPPEDASDEEKARYHADQGWKLWMDSRYADAEMAYREAIKLRPNCGHYHFMLSSSLENLGHLGEAVQEWGETVRLAPEDSQYRERLARCLEELGFHQEAMVHWQEAEQICRESIDRNPDRSYLHGWLATYLEGQGRHEEAEEERKRFRELCNL